MPKRPKVHARRFILNRAVDVSGISGEGENIAEGVEFSNGICVLSFHSEYAHANMYLNIRALIAVHGHEGKTKVLFIDPELK